MYEAGTGQGDLPIACSDGQGEAQVVLETEPGARGADLFKMLGGVGTGGTCLQVAAVDEAGESAQVPVAGQ